MPFSTGNELIRLRTSCLDAGSQTSEMQFIPSITIVTISLHNCFTAHVTFLLCFLLTFSINSSLILLVTYEYVKFILTLFETHLYVHVVGYELHLQKACSWNIINLSKITTYMYPLYFEYMLLVLVQHLNHSSDFGRQYHCLRKLQTLEYQVQYDCVTVVYLVFHATKYQHGTY